MPAPSMKTKQQYWNKNDRLVSTDTGGETLTRTMPAVGTYARLWLNIRAELSAASAGLNPFGLCSILKRVTLETNFTQAIFDCSGEGYNYLVRPHLGGTYDPLPGNNGRNKVGPGIVNLDMLIPIAMNLRDPVGVLVGGNQQALYDLSVTFRPDSEVASDAAYVTRPVVQPWLEWFTIPPDPANRWPTNLLHQILESKLQIAQAGENQYEYPRGGTFIGLYHGMGFGEIDTPSGTDTFDTVDVRVNQSNYIMRGATPEFFDMLEGVYRGQERLPGTFALDMTGSAGLGDFDQFRDALYTQFITAGQTVPDFNTTGTLYVVRRQLVPLGRPGGGQAGGR